MSLASASRKTLRSSRIIPVAPPVPGIPRKIRSPKEKRLRSDYAIAGGSAGLLLLGGWLLHRLRPKRQSQKENPGKTRSQ